MKREVVLLSEEDTERLATEVASQLKGGETIALIGELGAGKTTFTRYLVKAISPELEVSSPTYVLQHEYPGKTLSVEHWDLYRVGSLPDELYEPPSKTTVRVIEWADRFETVMNSAQLRIFLLLENNGRRARIE